MQSDLSMLPAYLITAGERISLRLTDVGGTTPAPVTAIFIVTVCALLESGGEGGGWEFWPSAVSGPV